MTISTNEELERNTSGRFVRNLALSLSGGALLTLLGAGASVAGADEAGVAAPDEGVAGTASLGTGAAGTGDATAVGNQSGTNTTQTVTVSGNLGVIQVINQQANVNNVGVGVANTGGNIAIGNASNNTAGATQGAGGGTSGSAINNGEAGNSSNGGALISTGAASAVGNQSNTSVLQEAHGSAHGSLGGILVINQDANVLNAGLALANTGGNAALGNGSVNTAGLLQGSTADGLANNNGKATNNSDGKATINTGAASATGNKSDTTITQRATGSAGGSLGGLMIIDQDAFVANVGVGVANSGLNAAGGNLSGGALLPTGPNTAGVDQTATSDGTGGDVGIASNSGEASNNSNGTANIRTGNTGAIGNDSTTKINQSATSSLLGGGVSLTTQDSDVINAGLGIANSGLNAAAGNLSVSNADLLQTADADGVADDVQIAGNFGKAANASDGTGSVSSGSAWAAGNRSTTEVNQDAITLGGALTLRTQDNTVLNAGVGLANSGLNLGVGNVSQNDAAVSQNGVIAAPGDPDVDVAVLGQFGLAENDSDGTANITTGDAHAVGNDSDTVIDQKIDPTGVAVQTQNANVTNFGVGIANSGGNAAVGNASDNDGNGAPGAGVTQTAGITAVDDLEADTLVLSNNGQASNLSDGTAEIHTGNAYGTGNRSGTTIGQSNDASVEGLGAVINIQDANVTNVGLGVANSGGNIAAGNVSQNDALLSQVNDVASADDLEGDVIIVANNGTAENLSDGTARIHTGNAEATGNHSMTELYQVVDGDVNGSGIVVNSQDADVLNAGAGFANSGINGAVGNASNNEITGGPGIAGLTQGNFLGGVDDLEVDGPLTVVNTAEASNASDGTADIRTGNSQATGNTSNTWVQQAADGDIDHGGMGALINIQEADVDNVGLAVANSGVNGAVGNASVNDANLSQGNFLDGDIDDVDGPFTVSNAGRASNASDGLGHIHTGDAQAQGNVSSSILGQQATGHIGPDGMGVVPNVQNATITNFGVGIANSGVNGAVGNASGLLAGPNSATLTQQAITGTDGVDLEVDGPLTNTNSGEASNTSDGTGKVKTGGALASGNVSASNLRQHIGGDVAGMGLVVGPQNGTITNVGVGVANSGINAAVGNASFVNSATATQNASFTPAVDTDVDGPLTVGNQGQATNTSDGEACVCTGNAVASGNVSSSTLTQDLIIGVDDGLSVVPMDGAILNAGFGLANSGVNLAIGNVSQNTALTTQDLVLDPGAPGDLDGPQTFVNGGGANNASNGTGKVGTGNAKATGNLSSSDLNQAALVDGAGAFAAINGNINNVGAGVANAGVNLGIGNASVNSAVLDQDASGVGTVSNNGTADNNSDGFGGVGDPLCEDVVPGAPGTPAAPGKPGTPGLPGLPKTGGPLEVEAALGLMLLLAGFGFRRAGKRLA